MDDFADLFTAVHAHVDDLRAQPFSVASVYLNVGQGRVHFAVHASPELHPEHGLRLLLTLSIDQREPGNSRSLARVEFDHAQSLAIAREKSILACALKARPDALEGALRACPELGGPLGALLARKQSDMLQDAPHPLPAARARL